MHKYLLPIIAAVITALLIASFAGAQPGIGISKTAPLSGKGSVADPLKITVCANGESYVSNGTSWACSAVAGGGGDITSVGATAGGGLTGGATSGAATLGLLTTCASGQLLQWDGAAWACDDDDIGSPGAGDIESVTAGNGLTGGGTVGALTLDVACNTGLTCNANDVALSMAGASCSAGQYMSALTSTGTGTCTAEVGDISGVTASAPISGGGTSGAISVGLTTCSNGQIYKMSGGSWTCSADDTGAGAGDITAVNVASGGGIEGGATSGAATVGLLTSCNTYQALTWGGPDWGCTDIVLDITASDPSGLEESGVETRAITMRTDCNTGDSIRYYDEDAEGPGGVGWYCYDDNLPVLTGNTVPKADGAGGFADSSITDDGSLVTINDSISNTNVINGNTQINGTSGGMFKLQGATNGLTDGQFKVVSHKNAWGNITAQFTTTAGGSTSADNVRLQIDSGQIIFRPGNGTDALTIAHGGATTLVSTLQVSNTAATISSGTGSPEGAVTAPVGSIFLRTDNANSFYVKQTGAGNTGWVLK